MKEEKPLPCRVCLQSGEEFKSLYEQLDNAAVFEHIMSIAMVTISQDDGFPDHVCPSCFLQLQAAVNFKKRCEDTDRLLRNIPLRDISTNEEIEVKKEEISIERDLEDYPSCNYSDSDDYQDSPDNLFSLGKIEKYDEDAYDNYIPLQDADDIIPKPAKGQLFSPQCNECLQYFRSKCKLRVHWKKEHMKTILTCHLCKRIFKSMHAFNKHKSNLSKLCHGNVNNSDKFIILGEGKLRKFKCKECGYTTERYNHMNTHLVVHTPGDRPFKCKYCSVTYTQRGSLYSHMKEKHDLTSGVICSVCGKDVKSTRRLYRHMMKHRVPSIPCPLCKLKFKRKEGLKSHMKRHEGIKTFQCEACPSLFFTIAEMCNHRRTVHVRKMIKCGLCEFQSVRKITIARHESQHGGSKPFPCIKCGKFYDSLHQLQRHLDKYHKPKIYACLLCDKTYSTSKSRRNHVKKNHECKSEKIKTSISGKVSTTVLNEKTKSEPDDMNSISSNE